MRVEDEICYPMFFLLPWNLRISDPETAWWNFTKFWQSAILIDQRSTISSLGSTVVKGKMKFHR
jgi:hypothetical protein